MLQKLLGIAVIGLSLPLTCHAYKVIGIADGDTLTILQDNRPVKLRLANVDAPEKSQPYGQRARQSLSALCWNKSAQYEEQDTDRYGRTVAVVTCGGVEVNRAQVEQGFAWVYPKYNRDPSLLQLQEDAREMRRGLWSDRDPVPPWKYRKMTRRSE